MLPPSGVVLEIASGTGQHAVHFARALPRLVWQPSDPDAQARASIEAWRDEENLPNLRAPLDLDVRATPWPIERCDAIVCINMIHISPWASAEALFAGASALLGEGAPLYLYGPYRIHGEHTAPSNAAFDASLKRQDPSWGVRDLDDVTALAARSGFEHAETVQMPANNLSVIFRRRA